ncbi:MAG: tannase/feruloyl esterase family alpha/beta hydrolase [Alphaproteobacteria bacterium]|nr:tannase/feruloyl esterase family alpha/beta hydrolase [Alphaproteobacteria bacterium]
MKGSFLAALVLCSTAAPAMAQTAKSDADCTALTNLALPHATITAATAERSGVFHEERAANGKPRDHEDLPPYCRVLGSATPVPDSKIGFEIWLPLGGWTGRLQAIGNGAYDDRIYYAQMAQRVQAGDVVVATDTGHKGGELSFGVGHPEAIIDWGSGRAVHESTVAAKAVAQALFGNAPRYAYFAGCSTGGHQALAAAQRYPNDYDGIIAGDPGNDRTNLNLTFLWHFLKNHAKGDNSTPILTPAKLKMVRAATVAACDGLDGVKDGVINDPRQCKFDVASLACQPGQDEAQCLTPSQVDAMKAMYAGPTDVRTGKPLYAPFLPGSEGSIATPDDRYPGWSAYWANTRKPEEPQRVDSIRLWVYNDPSWNWWSFDWGKDIDTVRAKLVPMIDATSTDLSAFKAHGGKLILFTGWDDPVGAPLDIVDYYEKLGAPESYARLYMVPGMVHCAQGSGATNFSTATRDSVPPVSDARHDMGVALRDWVEQSRAPAEIVATHFDGPQATEGKGRVAFQRPLCPWPRIAKYKGGPTEQAESFACEAP